MDIPGYEIESCIGQGGMACAYLARQTSLERKVVLKVLDTSVTDSAVTIERFLNEGRIVASLQHPHIITTYDIGRAGSDVFISMEYVDGGDLKQRLREGTFAPNEAVELLAKIASALGAAHAKGIVHRDVKPGNILFREDGTPLLSDFGIAKRLGGDADLTSTGMFVGSPNYMAPEQSDVGPVDGRADIYSLGVIFFEMLTGRKPYLSESVIDVILKHKKDPVPKLPAGLEAYQELLELMMAKDRNDRFRDAMSLIHYLERLADSDALKAKLEQVPTVGMDDTTLDRAGLSDTAIGESSDNTKRMRALLIGIAAVCLVAYGVLLLVERRLDEDAVPNIAQVATTIEEIANDPLPENEISSAQSKAQIDKVIGALGWLGTHSLNEYRLTAPRKDNAYYYFSRLLQLDPSNERARAGLLEIASRYALLAEREIADGDHERARSYITIGLQVDPNNEALLVMRELASPGTNGFFATLRRLFE